MKNENIYDNLEKNTDTTTNELKKNTNTIIKKIETEMENLSTQEKQESLDRMDENKFFVRAKKEMDRHKNYKNYETLKKVKEQELIKETNKLIQTIFENAKEKDEIEKKEIKKRKLNEESYKAGDVVEFTSEGIKKIEKDNTSEETLIGKKRKRIKNNLGKENPITKEGEKTPQKTQKEEAEETVVSETFWDNGNTLIKTFSDETEEIYNEDGSLWRKKSPDGTKRYYNQDGTFRRKELLDGAEEHYNKDGSLYKKKLPDKMEEFYRKDGTIYKRVNPDGTIENYESVKEKMEELGLTENDFKNIPEWQELSTSQKIFIMEESSQKILSRVRELGEKRFQEKNKINFSLKPKKWELFTLLKKVKNLVLKSYWISKEEKDVIKEVRQGKIKPNQETLKQLTERMSDMDLNIVEKMSGLMINFTPTSKNMSKEEKDVVEKYNLAATKYSKMPDTWKNKKASHKKEYLMFTEVNFSYEKQRNNLVKLRAKKYKESGFSKDESEQKAMIDVRDIDYKIAILQFTNTNPDVVGELRKIENEDSWKRLLNNENLWRSFYVGVGFGARKGLTAAFGLIAAPFVSGAIGGIRARRKASQRINETFKKGREEKTFREREAGNRTGLFIDKKNEQGIISKTLSGRQINTKEVASFVDADSQIQRLNNLFTKMNQTKTLKAQSRIASHISTRIKYIELKSKEGLINYGTKNPIATNYELLKLTSYLSFLITDPLTEKLKTKDRDKIKKEISDRNKLLDQIMRKNIIKFGKKQAQIKNREMLRGVAISASFSLLGWKIRDLMEHGGEGAALMNHNIKQEHLKEVHNVISSKPINPIPGKTVNLNNNEIATLVKPRVEAIADHGQGAISTLRELQKNLRAEYGDSLKNAPESVKHILNTNANKLAQEYGMYKPGQDAESAFIKSGSSFQVDKYGNVTYHPEGGGSSVILEKGTAVKVDKVYKGKMFDSDHSTRITKSIDLDQGKIINFDSPKIEIPPRPGIADKTIINIPKQVPIEQTPVGPKSSIIEVKRTQLSPEEYKSMVDTKQISKHVMKRMQRIYENNINKMFPSSKSLVAWNSIKNSTGDYSAEKLVNWNQPISSTYKTLILEMKKLNKITGLKPWDKSILHPAETPEEYIVRSSRKLAEIGKLHKFKL